MEKDSANRDKNWRLWALFSYLWKRTLENICETYPTTKKGFRLNWRQYERHCAQNHRGRHIGGPGKEDYKRGCVKGEVKHLSRPLTKPEVMKARQKGITEISVLNGFTEPAKEYAKKRNIRLFSRRHRVR